MPFDMMPTVETEKHLIFKRLLVLRELLPKTGDQGSWYTCLWSEARDNRELRELGMRGGTHSPLEQDHVLFGPNAGIYFGGSDSRYKMTFLNEDIAALEQELVTV
jgi:hypothetical protein